MPERAARADSYSGFELGLGAQNTAQAMTPHLPLPDDPPMPANGGNFEDRVLLLLAAVAMSDGMLTYPEYELTGKIVRSIFGDKALYADMQARFHYALLNPPELPNHLAQTLAKEAADQNVSGEQIQALRDGLDELCAHRGELGDEARHLQEVIEIAFAEQNLLTRRERLGSQSNPANLVQNRAKNLEQSASLGFGSGLGSGLGNGLGSSLGKAAVDGTLSLVQSVSDFAHKLLPRRKEAESAEFFAPSVVRFNQRINRNIDQLFRISWALGEDDLQRELATFRRNLADQPFKVVLVGEGKRGKSTLVNAILGDDLSPVQESLPETATVAEFFYAPLPSYNVRFLDEECYSHLENYLAGEEDNLFLRKRVASVRDFGGKDRPRGLAKLTSRADIREYLAADGRYSALVGRVGIGLPLQILSGGMVIVDTPGLNATDSFQDYLAYEESISADCLIVVLDARRPDSASELRLLRKLAAAGRAVSIIGVMTGVDRLNQAKSVEAAATRASDILTEACKGAPGLHILGLVPIDARKAMEARTGHEPKEGRDNSGLIALNELFNLLTQAISLDKNKELYRKRIAAHSDQLAKMVRARSLEALSNYRISLPPAQFLELLERHSERLSGAASAHAEQARSVIASAAHDVEAWRVQQTRALDAWEEMLVLRVMEAARQKADSLGNSFARESSWQTFDAEDAPIIARQSLDEFLQRQQEQLYAWNDKLRLFTDEIQELSALCLRSVDESAVELGDICSTAGLLDHVLVQSNAQMRKLAVFLAGAGSGALLVGSLMNLVAVGSAAFLVFAHPLILPGAALVGVAAYALRSVGNLETRKAAFLARKKKKTTQWAAEVRLLLEAELQAAREELAASYKSAVARGFVPALEILVGEAVHLDLYLKVIDKIRADTDKFEQTVEASLADIQAAVDGC